MTRKLVDLDSENGALYGAYYTSSTESAFCFARGGNGRYHVRLIMANYLDFSIREDELRYVGLEIYLSEYREVTVSLKWDRHEGTLRPFQFKKEVAPPIGEAPIPMILVYILL